MTYSAQSPQGANPLRLSGAANLACAAIKSIGGVPLVLEGAAGLQRLSGMPLTIAETGAYLVVGLLLLASALRQSLRGLTQLGALIVPPRAPADLSDYSSELATPLRRRELPAYKLPANEHYGLAHRFFPQRFPMLPRRLRQQVDMAVSSATNTAWLVAAVLAGLWAVGFLPPEIQRVFDGLPVLFVGGVVAGAAVRVAFAVSQMPAVAPRIEREEFRFSSNGGGDPKQIPIGLEHELMSLRPQSGAPNRGMVTGFDLRGGGVADSGDYSGEFVLETQPEIAGVGEASFAPVVAVAAALLTAAGTYMIAARPDYLFLAALASSDELSAALYVRVAARMVGGIILLGSATRAVAQLEHFLAVVRFRSFGILVSVQGTYGRTSIRVGKAVRDSIESDNVLVRSDSSVVGYVARLETESVGLMGERTIVDMKGDALTHTVRRILEEWFERFRSRGADIVGVDMTSEKVGQLVQANVAIDAQRAGAKAHARNVANRQGVPPGENDGRWSIPGGTSGQLASGDGAGERSDSPPRGEGREGRDGLLPDGDSKTCPDCAETVRRAARKCRFCGHEFWSAG